MCLMTFINKINDISYLISFIFKKKYYNIYRLD